MRAFAFARLSPGFSLVALPFVVTVFVQFRPPLEELRAGYYREMKKFISIPSLFTGFGNAEVFAPMAERNAASLTQVYRKVRTRAGARAPTYTYTRSRRGWGLSAILLFCSSLLLLSALRVSIA